MYGKHLGKNAYDINLKEQNAILHEVTFHVQTKSGKSQKFNVYFRKDLL